MTSKENQVLIETHRVEKEDALLKTGGKISVKKTGLLLL